LTQHNDDVTDRGRVIAVVEKVKRKLNENVRQNENKDDNVSTSKHVVCFVKCLIVFINLVDKCETAR
jgi:hypothetical protein